MAVLVACTAGVAGAQPVPPVQQSIDGVPISMKIAARDGFLPPPQLAPPPVEIPPYEGQDAEFPCIPQGPPKGVWVAGAEVIWLQRSQASTFLLAEARDPTTGALAGTMTSDANITATPGQRVWFRRVLSDWTSLETAYTGINQWASSGTLLGDPAGPLLSSPWLSVDNLAALGGGFNSSVTFNYTSQLHSAELNLRRRFYRGDFWTASAVSGIRFLYLGEQFGLNGFDTSGAEEHLNIRTQNNLLGLQFGGDARCQVNPRLQMELVTRGGMFMNFASQQTQNTNNADAVLGPLPPGSLPPLVNGSANQTSFSGMLQVGLNGIYQLHERFALRGGYQVWMISGLALAPEQLNGIASAAGNVNTLTGNTLNDNGRLVMYGPTAGFEYRW